MDDVDGVDRDPSPAAAHAAVASLGVATRIDVPNDVGVPTAATRLGGADVMLDDVGEAEEKAERVPSDALVQPSPEQPAATLSAEVDILVGALSSVSARVRELEVQSERAHATIQSLRAIALHILPGDLAALDALVEALVRRPNDLLVMAKLAEDAGKLATLLEVVRQVRSGAEEVT